MPVLITGNGVQSIEIDGLQVVNVFDTTTFNRGGGTYSSLLVASDFEGTRSFINDLRVTVDVSTLPAGLSAILTAQTTRAYGIYLNAAATGKIRLSNIHVGGFYRQLPTAIGLALNASNFRDWNQPSLPPADTAGQVTNASVYFYRSCTMHGDAA
jgi:hypothetical protein